MDSDNTVNSILYHVGSVCFITVLMVLQVVLQVTQYGFTNFPMASRMIVWVVAFFVGYRVLRRIVRMWIRMFIAGLKLFVFVLTIFLCLAIYLRGSKFFTQDIFYIKHTIEDSIHSKQSFSDRFLWNTFVRRFESFIEHPEEQARHYAENVKNEYGIEFDESYIDYVNDKFYGDKTDKNYDDVAQKVHDFVNNLGVDVNELGHNLMGMFGGHE